jgi:hypothetical protein
MGPGHLPRILMAALAALALACKEGAITDPDASAPGDAASVDADSGIRPDAGRDAPVVVGLAVTPTTAALLATNGGRPSADFAFTLLWSDGTRTATAGLAATVEPSLFGTWERGPGRFTSSGRVGGTGRLRVRAAGGRFGRDISVRVQLEQVDFAPGTEASAAALFDAPAIEDPARRADVVYPLDGVVMPQNVAPALIQWSRSAPGDVFRVRIDKPSVRVRAYSAQPAGSEDGWLVPLDAWRRIAQSEGESTALISVDRYEAASGQVIAGSPVRVRFARAALLGSIYYWDIAAGRIIRIQDGTAQREAFLPSPPENCIGCHSVSPSGRWLAGRFGGGDNYGGVMDLTADLTGSPPPQRFPVGGTRWWFSSWSPDERRLVVTVDEIGPGRGLALVDALTGGYVAPAGGALPTGPVSHPAWSPDGQHIAYVGDMDNWGGVNTAGNLYLLPVTGADTFGAPQLLVDGRLVPSQPGFAACSYPSWTPDSSALVFAQGTGSRSENASSELWMVRRDGSGLVRLGRASDSPDGFLSYQPRFSPFTQGGYHWVSFLSRRSYGNARLGTRNRQQIWVAAVKANPAPGEDPSEVPYWLPGQDTASMNISAYWAPRACRAERETCDVDAECCSGDCQAGPGGEGVCAEPETTCVGPGDPCRDSSQCCDDVLCIDGVCGVQ